MFIGVNFVIKVGGLMAITEREDITGVWRRNPQRGPGAEPLVRGSGEAESILSSTSANGCKLLKYAFWATVCKTVRPMLLDRCLSLYVLSVTLVYCGQTVGWINTPLGVEVCLRPGHIVLDGDLAPPKGHNSPQFSTHVYCDQPAGWIKMPLGTEIDLGPGNIVLGGDPAPPTERGTASPNFLAYVYVCYAVVVAFTP